MDKSQIYFHAIGANLKAIKAILSKAMQDVDNALDAIENWQQDTAIGSIWPAETLLQQAGIVIQATLILHRQR
jgi:hypothetical protein